MARRPMLRTNLRNSMDRGKRRKLPNMMNVTWDPFAKCCI